MPSVSVGVVQPQVGKSHNGERDMTDEKLYGIHPILAVLQEERRRIAKIFISAQRRGAEVQRIIALAAQRGIPIVTVERARLLTVPDLYGERAVWPFRIPYASNSHPSDFRKDCCHCCTTLPG